MGWSSGTSLIRKLIVSINRNILNDSNANRTVTLIYIDMITAFEEADWDNLDEVIGIDSRFDDAVRWLYPNYFEEEE